MSASNESSQKLSLTSAILMNVNVTLGSGIFINLVLLSSLAGPLSGLTYIIIGILLLPLILTFSNLLKYYPSGGFYIFAKNGISTFAGFISAWSYFVGKLASASLAIHVAISLLQTIFVPLSSVPTLVLDIAVVIFYAFLNMLNIKQGSRIQVGFICLKMIPIFFVLICGIFFFNPEYISISGNFVGLTSTLPLALFTFYGFEAACNISMHIANPERNAARAVIISHLIATCITFLFQTLFYASLGDLLAIQPNYLSAFPAFILTFFSLQPVFAKLLIALLHVAIASSALGASYGIMYGNAWNLYTLSKHEHVFFSHFFTKLNKNGIAVGAILVEAFICSVYLIISRGAQLVLQPLAVFSLTATFTLSSISYFFIARRTNQSLLIPSIAIGVCLALLSMCLRNFFRFGFTPLIVFVGIFLLGVSMYKITSRRNNDLLSA